MPTHHRRSIRLPDYDYTQPGAYFVTICTFQMQNLFGDVVGGEMQLNQAGLIVRETWMQLANQFPNIHLDAFAIMPNHVHGIIAIRDSVGATRPNRSSPKSGKLNNPNTNLAGCGGSPLPPHHDAIPRPNGPGAGSLGAIIGQFKSRVTKRIWKIATSDHPPIWQRNYYEHIIRDDHDWANILAYIQSNPAHWDEDRFHTKGRPVLIHR